MKITVPNFLDTQVQSCDQVLAKGKKYRSAKYTFWIMLLEGKGSPLICSSWLARKHEGKNLEVDGPQGGGSVLRGRAM